MEALPGDLKRTLVLRYLCAHDVAALAATCRAWRTVANAEPVWAALLASAWPHVAGVDGLQRELGDSARATFAALWVAMTQRLARRRLRACAVAIVGDAHDGITRFLRTGAERAATQMAEPPVLSRDLVARLPHPCLTIQHKGNYVTFCRVRTTSAAALLDYDVVVQATDTHANARRGLLHALRRCVILAPLASCELNGDAVPFVAEPGEQEVSFYTISSLPGVFFNLVYDMPVLARSTLLSHVMEADGSGGYAPLPWVRRALRAIHEYARSTGDVAEIWRYLRNNKGDNRDADDAGQRDDGDGDDGATVPTLEQVMSVEDPRALLLACGYGRHMLLHDAARELEPVAVGDALNAAHSALVEIDSIVSLILQERHPEWWAPAVEAAKRWLSHVVTVARPQLAQDVGLADAVRVCCARFAPALDDGNYGVYSAIQCLSWARSGELGSHAAQWRDVAVAAAHSARLDVREAGEQLLEMDTLWSTSLVAEKEAPPQMSVRVTMTVEREDVVVVVMAAPRSVAPPPVKRRSWWRLFVLSLLGSSAVVAALQWWWKRRQSGQTTL